ncbi:MAG: GNAT family acetyltransferase [Rhodospirillaceae bacterium]
MINVRIRPYIEADLPAVTALWDIVFPDDATRNRAPAAIPQKQDFQPGLIFVAETDGQIVGTTMAGYDGHRGWLYGVAVHPDHQRQGIATELVNHAVAKLRSLGCLKVNLQVREGNESVTAFYESLGFEVEPRVSMGKLVS